MKSLGKLRERRKWSADLRESGLIEECLGKIHYKK